jgi:methanogen homoisocitrate dehydrogenase
MTKIAVVEGDGIGREVIPAAVKILQFAEPELELVPLEVGYEKWKRTGRAITPEDLEIMRECNCILFGAITTPPDPDYKSVLVQIRRELDLYANIRPYKYLGLHLPQYTPTEPFNFTIVRENTEGLYSGIENITNQRATTLRVLTRKGCERIANIACRIAKKKNTDITIVHKANVLKSDAFFKNIAAEIAEKQHIPCSEAYVDAMAYHLILHPENYHVLLTTNLFGDILSDLAAALVGGLGLCPSANIGEDYALFEPVHGSAPDIAGKNLANPIAALLSTKMMLRWLGKTHSAEMIERGVEHIIKHRILTPDLGGEYHTTEVVEAVLEYLRKEENLCQ